MSWPKDHRDDAEAAQRWSARLCANMSNGSEGEPLKPKTGRSFENIASVSRGRPGCSSRSKPAREARRNLPHTREGPRAWSEARLLRRSISNLCCRTRRCVDRHLCPRLRGDSRTHDRSRVGAGRRPATNLRDPLRFPHLDVQKKTDSLYFHLVGVQTRTTQPRPCSCPRTFAQISARSFILPLARF